jgi:hypothetical protein
MTASRCFPRETLGYDQLSVAWRLQVGSSQAMPRTGEPRIGAAQVHVALADVVLLEYVRQTRGTWKDHPHINFLS